jgi:hypothetical protein
MTEHGSCVQIDAGVECVRLPVETHGYLPEKDAPSWARFVEKSVR